MEIVIIRFLKHLEKRIAEVEATVSDQDAMFAEKIGAQERKTNQMLEDIRTELREKFQEQKGEIAKQAAKLAEQSETILKQEETIAELEEKLARHEMKNDEQEGKLAIQETRNAEQDSRMDRLEAKNAELDVTIVGQQESIVKHEESTPQDTPLTTTTPQDSLLFITGGYNGNRMSATETYPRSSNCSPPSLPLGRNAHTTFVTSEPTALVATCGGFTEEGRT